MLEKINGRRGRRNSTAYLLSLLEAGRWTWRKVYSGDKARAFEMDHELASHFIHHELSNYFTKYFDLSMDLVPCPALTPD